MILVDANLLVYAYVTDYEQHDDARAWLDDTLADGRRTGFAWSTLLAFVRLVTNARLYPEPASIGSAWTQVTSWLDAESAWVPVPGSRHRKLLGECLQTSGLRSNDVPDAHLAALALEYGLTLATSDSGFVRFDGLRCVNPLR